MSIAPTAAPAVLSLRPEGIPAELRDLPQWVNWRLEQTDKGKWTKVPHGPRTGRLAKSTDSRTWGTYQQALDAAGDYSGIGFVFAAEGGLAGIDLDDSRDPRTGEFEPWAAAILDRFDSYAEVSPSGTGAKIFLRGKLPGRGRKFGNVELYDQARYFCTTGWRLPDKPTELRDCGAELIKLYRELEQRHGGRRERKPHAEANGQPPAAEPLFDMSDGERELLSRLVAQCANPPDGDRSAADWRLCCEAHKWGWPREQVWQAVCGVGKPKARGWQYFAETWERAGRGAGKNTSPGTRPSAQAAVRRRARPQVPRVSSRSPLIGPLPIDRGVEGCEKPGLVVQTLLPCIRRERRPARG